ncbi:MAG: DUF3786 domain-containing protein [Candidatus Bathyarchaeota archaeon]|nr:DUF3786 domain-containing protein [Candidatus Bathyarchaeota archaeon]
MIKLNLQTQTLQKLRLLFNPQEDNFYDFLGYTLNLENGIVKDKLSSNSVRNINKSHTQILTTLLAHYSLANPTPLRGKLVKFKDIPGGYAYEDAFNRRAIQPIADVFGEEPEKLPEAAKLLGGLRLNLGEFSVEVTALKGIPLTYILWAKGEFPASASALYDESASSYLPTEDLAVLGELTTSRLLDAEHFLRIK